MVNSKLESLAYRLKDLTSLRSIFQELNFEFEDEPVNEESWKDEEKEIIENARIIAKKDDYKIYYLQTNTDYLKHWKGISTKIIKENHGLCLICSHNPGGFKWIFSSLSKEFSKSFSETRHIPIDINSNSGVPTTFVDFLDKLYVTDKDSTTSIVTNVSAAFDSFAVKIHDELTVNVFEALKVISEGIIGDKNNNLSLTDKTLEEIRKPIFILLYRIIFILYAEDRGIFPVDNKIYQDEFSLKWIKQEWLLKSINPKKLDNFIVQKRLKHLFRLIEVGSEELDYDKDEFFMRSYYGRIFDRKINSKLEEWNIPNSNFLEMLSLLTRTKDKKGNYFFLDYSALETRHLGSIYEHLLEFHLHVKNQKISNLPDPDERKSSGSYYTPKEIVDYVVENTIEPHISNIIKETSDVEQQIEKILSLKILDPAMGSGHFLLGAVEYMARRLCEIEFNDIPEKEYIEKKRDVVRKCIYGVDINPLAVDLAKLSLWLETLSSEKPLSFLSAHLKSGNSLIGIPFQEVFDEQQSLFENKSKHYFRKTVQDFLGFESLEDDTPSAVKSKIQKYSKMLSKGSVYYQLKGLLDIKTAKYFGIDSKDWRDLRVKVGIESIDFYSSTSGKSVKDLSDELNFFHWELEFPEIFYDQNGDKKENGGFDIIIMNPPYVHQKGTSDKPKISFDERDFFRTFFRTINAKKSRGGIKINLFVPFIEQSIRLTNRGQIGFIIHKNLIKVESYKEIRKYILENCNILNIVDLGAGIFERVVGETILMCLSTKNSSSRNDNSLTVKSNLKDKSDLIMNRTTNWEISQRDFIQNDDYLYTIYVTPEFKPIKQKIELNTVMLKDLVDIISFGLNTKDNKKYVLNSCPDEIYKPVVMGRDIERFKIKNREKFVRYDEKVLTRVGDENAFLSNEKIILQRIGVGLVGVLDVEQFYCFNSVNIILQRERKISLKIILAILNSKLMNQYYRLVFEQNSGLTVNVTQGYLEKIPIKINIENGKYIEELVDNIQQMKNNNDPQTDDLIRKLDNEIFKIYNLTEEEINFITNTS